MEVLETLTVETECDKSIANIADELRDQLQIFIELYKKFIPIYKDQYRVLRSLDVVDKDFKDIPKLYFTTLTNIHHANQIVEIINVSIPVLQKNQQDIMVYKQTFDDYASKNGFKFNTLESKN